MSLSKTCKMCGKEFTANKKSERYCGDFCRHLAKCERNRLYMRKVARHVGVKTSTCQHCGREFSYMTGRGISYKYCSTECRKEAANEKRKTRERANRKMSCEWNEPRTCVVCLDKFVPNHHAQKYCSKACRSAWHHGEDATLRRRERVRAAMETNLIRENNRQQTRFTLSRAIRSIEKSERMASEYGFNYGDVQKAKLLARMEG